METTHGIQGAKIALLIDFDNVILGVEDPGFDVELVVNALRARGIVVMGRAYGDWYRHHRHRRKLMEQGIELVETPVFGPVIKNSADIRIVLDGIDVALAHSHIDTFCLVSGDSDFLPLIKRLQLLGKNVIVIAGQKFTSELVRRNCNEYIAYENLLAESIGATEDVSTLDGACQLLQRAINTLLERGMDARSSTVKQMMLQMNPAFSERTFGCNQFKQFLDKATRTGAVKLGDRDSHSGEFAVLLVENGVALETAPREAAEKFAAREDPNTRRRERDRERRRENTENSSRETQNGAASTRAGTEHEPRGNSKIVAENAAPIETAPVAIEDELLAESGTSFNAQSDKPQTRGLLRRGRLKFSAKAGVSAIAAPETSVPSEATPENTPQSVAQAAPTETDGAASPREYSQDSGETPAPENETPIAENEAQGVLAMNVESETAAEDAEAVAPKRRTTRGGRRRKPKSETAAPASAEDSSSENSGEEIAQAAENSASDAASVSADAKSAAQTRKVAASDAASAQSQVQLDGGATSLESLPEVAPQTQENAALNQEATESAAPVAESAAEGEAAAPKRRAPRGRRSKSRPADAPGKEE